VGLKKAFYFKLFQVIITRRKTEARRALIEADHFMEQWAGEQADA
jgi:hypothetical protein